MGMFSDLEFTQLEPAVIPVGLLHLLDSQSSVLGKEHPWNHLEAASCETSSITANSFSDWCRTHFTARPPIRPFLSRKPQRQLENAGKKNVPWLYILSLAVPQDHRSKREKSLWSHSPSFRSVKRRRKERKQIQKKTTASEKRQPWRGEQHSSNPARPCR